MAALPYMRLYIADYLADTAHLSATQHGAYMLLIMNYWQTGKPLPADDVKLARIARMTQKEWAEHGAVLAEFFQDVDGAWHHKRIDQELDAVRAKSDKARNARQQRTSNGRSTNVGHSSEKPATNDQRPSIYTDTDTDTDTDKKTDSARTALDREFEEQFWPEYPLKKSRGAAERAYRTARRAADLETLLAALRRQKPGWTDPQFTKHASTWLNGKCWLDDAPSAKPSAPDQHAGRVKTYRETGYWNAEWGDRPEAAA